MTTTKQIEENFENDKILSLVLLDEFEQARYENSLQKVCDELGIDFIDSHSPLGSSLEVSTQRGINTQGEEISTNATPFRLRPEITKAQVGNEIDSDSGFLFLCVSKQGGKDELTKTL